MDDAKLPQTLDKSKLKRHILQLKDLSGITGKIIRNVRDVSKFLIDMEPLRRGLYWEIEHLVTLILSQPISVVQAERSF